MVSIEYQRPDEIGTETDEYSKINETFQYTDDPKLLMQQAEILAMSAKNDPDRDYPAYMDDP